MPGKFEVPWQTALTKTAPPDTPRPGASVLLSGDKCEDEEGAGHARGAAEKVLFEQRSEGNEGKAFRAEGTAGAKALGHVGRAWRRLLWLEQKERR